jgi:hypothetical protein
MAADSLTVTTDGHRCSLAGLHAIDAVGRLILWAPAHSCLVTEVATSRGGAVSTLVEVTDVAAVAVRDRVRARVAVRGSLSLVHAGTCSGTKQLRVQMQAAELVEAGLPAGGFAEGATIVDPDAFAAVEADPLCRAEPAMLLHLATVHPQSVAMLARLVEPRLLQSVVRIVPYSLDRYGIVLRLERLAGQRDVRLPFAERATDVAHAQRELNALLAAGARTRPCGNPVA